MTQLKREEPKKINFADLDGFLKIAPIIGLAVLAYLQTLFPSKVEFKEIQQQLIQMDKKITEMAVIQRTVGNNSSDIHQLEDRMRLIEVELARHNAATNRKKTVTN
jgi:TolA-binding protein